MTNEDLIKVSPAFAIDFENFLKENYKLPQVEPSAFFNLPFEFQIGVFIKFLQENTIDLDISDSSMEGFNSSILEGMKIYQNIAGHYS
ncbi:MAG TPA: hypothetical protein VF691_18525 [Cytophagaceae bacterium]|jgi:hypothetical protein